MKTNYNKLLRLLLKTGRLMLQSGAEIARVEDTLRRMAAAYGAQSSEVFAITSTIVMSLTFPGDEEVTQTMRITSPGSTNFTRLERLNALSRQCCVSPLPLDELEITLNEIEGIQKSPRMVYIGSVMAAAAFSIFFGGTLMDGLIAGCMAILICLLEDRLDPLTPNTIVFNLSCSLIVGIFAGLLKSVIPSMNLDYVLIGDIMLLIPGIAMTNSLRDMLQGDTISGINRLIESLLWAAALACGFMLAILLVRQIP